MLKRVLRVFRSKLPVCHGALRACAALCPLLLLLAFCAPGLYAQVRERSKDYDAVQKRLAKGWNTWDVHSVTTQVLLPEGLAIRVGVQYRTTLDGEGLLGDVLIAGGPGRNTEQVFPGPHAWNGSYTDVRVRWRELDLRIQSAHAGEDLVMLVTPTAENKPGHLTAAVVFSAAYLWNKPGTVARLADRIEAHGPSGTVPIYIAGTEAPFCDLPVAGPYLSSELKGPVGLSTGKRRSLEEIERLLEEEHQAYEKTLGIPRSAAVDAIETYAGMGHDL